jgi:hypothetical protein
MLSEFGDGLVSEDSLKSAVLANLLIDDCLMKAERLGDFPPKRQRFQQDSI